MFDNVFSHTLICILPKTLKAIVCCSKATDSISTSTLQGASKVGGNMWQWCAFHIGGHKAGKDCFREMIDEAYLFRDLLSAEEIGNVMWGDDVVGIHSVTNATGIKKDQDGIYEIC